MLEGFLHVFANRPILQILVDLLDLFVVAFIIYRVLLVIKGTRAVQMGMGLGLIFLVYVAAKWLGLVTLQNVFSSLLSSFILIVVVVFQNDIRRALMRIGSSALLGGLGRAMETRVVDEVVAAVTEIARHRMGALIAFEQDANLDEFVVGQGITLDSAVSKDLLLTIFIPEQANKLHDGAVIIRHLRLAKAGVFFPMPEARNIDPAFGSRHRAAIGITEETDAVVIVVSEERATISFCFNGNIVTNLDPDELRTTLLRIFGRAQPVKKGKKDTKKSIASPTSGRIAIATPPPPRVTSISKPPAAPKTSPMPSAEKTPRPKDISTPMPAKASSDGESHGGAA
ncbi:MAG: TIGR00159 family protein [Deltaproteobacteria bacterium]|nr:TIGR00159 family protein [Deltaproteobacteria bacterium]